MSEKDNFTRLINIAYTLISVASLLFVLLGSFLLYYWIDPNLSAFRAKSESVNSLTVIEDPNKIENGISLFKKENPDYKINSIERKPFKDM